ncbi:MAG: uracil phosphoribosyltransferase [Bdellovibrionaceae bacterium]|nr:uracil phosphoribosyltransferase [Pseudobdellovibrionaceae bacterium]
MQHHYGPQVHLLDNPFLSGVLARLCAPESVQPEINRLVELLYTQLISAAVNEQFDTEDFRQPTRMTAAHPELLLQGRRPDRRQKAIVVNLARAGTWPSHLCYDFLHHALPAENLRQDHIMAARMTDTHEHVTGTNFGGVKIGGGVKDSHVIIPDPMGATGNTIVSAIDHYKRRVEGPARRYIALHLIVTPEYLKRVLGAHPDAVIYALRLDRGLSPRQVLETPPGLHWDQEKGLNEKDYIVPGGGGFGEIMNNSFV